MNRKTLRSAFVVGALVAAACGSSDSDLASDDSAGGTTAATVAQTTTTSEPPTTEVPTTEATTTTAAETTTTEPVLVIPDPPPAGSGVLTVDGEDFPFTIETCNTEPAPSPVNNSVLVFEMRGSTVVEGQSGQVFLFRSELPSGEVTDSFGWVYATDRNDFETGRNESTPFTLTDHIIVEPTDAGTFFYGPPTQFERIEGISIIEDIDPGLGTIIVTC